MMGSGVVGSLQKLLDLVELPALSRGFGDPVVRYRARSHYKQSVIL